MPSSSDPPQERNEDTLSFVWIKRASWFSSHYLYQMKTAKEAQCWDRNVPPNCFPALWSANWTPFHCTMMIPGVLPGGRIIWKSTSSTLNYLPPEFEQRDEVEFTHSFHLTCSGSCFSRRLLDISVTSSRHPRKHSPGTGRQLSLLNRTATKKQLLYVAWNKTLIDGGRGNISQGERFFSPSVSSRIRFSGKSCYCLHTYSM